MLGFVVGFGLLLLRAARLRVPARIARTASFFARGRRRFGPCVHGRWLPIGWPSRHCAGMCVRASSVGRARLACAFRASLHHIHHTPCFVVAASHIPLHTHPNSQPTANASAMADVVVDGGPAAGQNAPPPVVRVADPLGQEVSFVHPCVCGVLVGRVIDGTRKRASASRWCHCAMVGMQARSPHLQTPYQNNPKKGPRALRDVPAGVPPPRERGPRGAAPLPLPAHAGVYV